MSVIPEDPLRKAPLSFDEWTQSFDVADSEERERLCKAAYNLTKDPVVARVLSKLEAQTLMAMKTGLKGVREDERMEMLLLLRAVDKLRSELQAMASDYEIAVWKNR